MALSLALLLAGVAAACGEPASVARGSGVGGAAGRGGAGGWAGAGAGAPAPAGGEGGLSLGGSAGGIPLAADELAAFVKSGGYLGFAASARFDSQDHGPVRVFVNAELEASLAAGSASHPIGSAAIREVYDLDLPDFVRGWGVMVKVEEAELGAGWLLFATDVFLGPEPTFYALGEPYCCACHLAAPDLVQGGYALSPPG